MRVPDILKIHNVFHVSPMEPCSQEGDEAEQLQLSKWMAKNLKSNYFG